MANNSRTGSIKPEYVTLTQAQEMTGLSRWTWRKYAAEGKVASVKMTKTLLIPVSEIERVINAGLRPATAID